MEERKSKQALGVVETKGVSRSSKQMHYRVEKSILSAPAVCVNVCVSVFSVSFNDRLLTFTERGDAGCSSERVQ